MAKKVYLIRAAQFYKIGISTSIEKRLAQVQTGCPITCEYVGYFPSSDPVKLEKYLHLILQDYKTKGEWFDLGDDNVRRLITEFNLKHVINPYTDVTQETERTTASKALKEARDITAQVNEVDRLYQESYPGWSLSDNGRAQMRRLLIKYGINVVSECVKHISTKADDTKFFDLVDATCKTYHNYGRHIPDRLWRVYHDTKRLLGKEEGSAVIRYAMQNNYDSDDGFYRLMNAFISNPQEFNNGNIHEFMMSCQPVLNGDYDGFDKN